MISSNRPLMVYLINMTLIKVVHLKMVKSLLLLMMLLKVQAEAKKSRKQMSSNLQMLSTRMEMGKLPKLSSLISQNNSLIAIDYRILVFIFKQQLKKIIKFRYTPEQIIDIRTGNIYKLYQIISILQIFGLLFNFIIRRMLNPESYHSTVISPKMMYSYDRGFNKSWNMPQYKAPALYHDAKLQQLKRKWATQKKGEKTNKYVTKRGFYMDYDLKISKSIPGSNVHNSQEPWSFKKQQEKAKQKKVDSKLKKNTYIEQIQNEQLKRKKPGIGTYSLEKSIKEQTQEIQKLRKIVKKTGQKRYFYEDTEHLSQLIPGSGSHNPHDSVEKLKINKTNFKFWNEKHKKQSQRDRKRELSIPTAGTYTPLSQSFTTFQKLLLTPTKDKKNGFGADARFPYVRSDKKVIKQIRPSPNTYNTGMNWRGKKYQQKAKQWHEAIWKGSLTQSVYRD